MPFSSLFVILAAAGLIPVGAAAVFGLELQVFLAYNFILFALWAVDLFITPGKRFFAVTRLCDEKLSLGTDNYIIIKVRNNSRFILKARLRDEIPPYFNVPERETGIRLYPHFESKGSYNVIPLKRGEFTFGSVYMRCRGVLGLCFKTSAYEIQENLKVYPNLKDLRKFSLAAIEKTRLLAGLKKSRVYGIGTEFESLKEYTEGDDYRKINWMATARANKLIVNNYEPEKNQQVFLLVDSSRVMNSEIDGVKKLDYSINAAFLLADVATRKGDNTGLLVFDSEVRRFVKPGKGQGQFNLIASNLYNVEEKLVTADYGGALTYLNNRQKRRSLLCLFTDISSRGEALNLVKTLKSVSAKHLPMVISIKDERIEKLASAPVNESEEAFARGAAVKLSKERESIRKVFSNAGIASIDVPPDRLSVEVINRYLVMKDSLQL